MRYISNLPKIKWGSMDSLLDSRPAILITSPTSFKKSKNIIKNLNIVQTIYIKSAEKEYAKKLVKEKHVGKVIYALGGGRVCDLGRFIAHKWDLEIICIPTVISTDAFLVDCTGLREKGCVTYFPSKKADLVLLDYNLLKKSPKRFHLSGCGDVLSIYTGLFDWKYANNKKKVAEGERYSESEALMAESIFRGLLTESSEIRKVSKKGLSYLVQFLAMEVQLCNFYGNSRPEEGGEHFFTYAMENKLKNFLHGEMIAFSVLLTAFIQGQDITEIKSFMDSVGLKYVLEGLNRPIVLKALNEMQGYVKMHHLRYSIYNDLSPERIRKLNLEKFFSLIQLN